MTELKLISKVRENGDKNSANILIKNYYKEIYTYVYKQLNNNELSKDLTQEIFISVLRGIGSYEDKKASFKTWIYKIASNKIIDYYRSKNYKYVNSIVEIDDINNITFHQNIESELIKKENIKEILNVVNRLESNIQQIFRMKVFGDMTFSEIANILDLSESTIKTKYYRTIKKIQKELKEEF